jgi:hypothetical protein
MLAAALLAAVAAMAFYGPPVAEAPSLLATSGAGENLSEEGKLYIFLVDTSSETLEKQLYALEEALSRFYDSLGLGDELALISLSRTKAPLEPLELVKGENEERDLVKVKDRDGNEYETLVSINDFLKFGLTDSSKLEEGIKEARVLAGTRHGAGIIVSTGMGSELVILKNVWAVTDEIRGSDIPFYGLGLVRKNGEGTKILNTAERGVLAGIIAEGRSQSGATAAQAVVAADDAGARPEMIDGFFISLTSDDFNGDDNGFDKLMAAVAAELSSYESSAPAVLPPQAPAAPVEPAAPDGADPPEIPSLLPKPHVIILLIIVPLILLAGVALLLFRGRISVGRRERRPRRAEAEAGAPTPPAGPAKRIGLLVIDRQGNGRDTELDADKNVFVGRAGFNTLRIPDERISSRHFVIESEGEEYYITDLSSTNGTFLNGARIGEKRRLANNDVITAGSNKFVFRRKS